MVGTATIRVLVVLMLVVFLGSALSLPDTARAAPSDPISFLANQLGSRLIRIWGYDGDWQVYDPATPDVSDLKVLERGRGYWVGVTADCIVYTRTSYYNLRAGWNLIGWLESSTSEPMAYETGSDSVLTNPAGQWIGQTFTAYDDRNVVLVSVKLVRKGNVGDMSFYLASAREGVPASVLAVSSIDTGKITTLVEGDWYSILLPAAIRSGVTYAVYLGDTRLPTDVNNYIGWRVDSTSPTYSSGNVIVSNNRGATWESRVATDAMFAVVTE